MLLALLSPLVLASCSEDDNTVEEFPDWRNRNEAYFSDILNTAKVNADGTWKTFLSYALEDTTPTTENDYIAVKVLRPGTGSGCPMFTDSVKINYRGRLVPSTSYAEGYVFDQSYVSDEPGKTSLPVKFRVGDLVTGFTTALQYMHEGDVWWIYIPSELGYGSQSSGLVLSYSTLTFYTNLVAIYRAGEDIPDWK